MTTVEEIALGASVVWLAALTFAVVLCVRQIGVMSVAARSGRGAAGTNSLPLGAALPRRAATILGESSTPVHLIFLSSSCGSCTDVARTWPSEPLDYPTVLVLTGAGGAADRLASYAPDRVRIIRDGDADFVTEALEVRATPFGMTIAEGFVVGHVFLTQIAEMQAVLPAPQKEIAA